MDTSRDEPGLPIPFAPAAAPTTLELRWQALAQRLDDAFFELNSIFKLLRRDDMFCGEVPLKEALSPKFPFEKYNKGDTTEPMLPITFHNLLMRWTCMQTGLDCEGLSSGAEALFSHKKLLSPSFHVLLCHTHLFLGDHKLHDDIRATGLPGGVHLFGCQLAEQKNKEHGRKIMNASHFRDGFLSEVLLEDLRSIFNFGLEDARYPCPRKGCTSTLCSLKTLREHCTTLYGTALSVEEGKWSC